MPDMSGMAGAMPDKMPTTQEEAEQMQQELMKKLKEMQEKQR
jgi:hypothetical protein